MERRGHRCAAVVPIEAQLRLLNDLHRNGLLADAELEDKRQGIIA